MKKALLITTVSGFVPQFEMENVYILQSMGFEVHYAANYDMPSYGDDNSRLEGTGIICHQVDFARSPYSRQNIRAYHQLVQLMTEVKFELVHCHTPMGGALGRLAAHKTRTGPVVYTVHGFHFYKGAPMVNWVIYYSVERYLARYTDMLITINEEDYKRAKKLKAGIVRIIHGVGINTAVNRVLKNEEREQIREKLHIEADKIVLISVGELNDNKNQIMVLKALKQLPEIEHIRYLVCGKGPLREKLEKFVKINGLQNVVSFLGYRNDLNVLLQISDIFVMPSKREGMPTSVMEAMLYSLPVIATDIRGNNELIEDGKNGFLIPVKDYQVMVECIQLLINSEKMRKNMGKVGRERIARYSNKNVKEEMVYNYDFLGF